MSEDTRFVASNMNKAIYEFRSEVGNHLAPNVTLISSDNVKVKGHSNILASCHYFKELFNKDKTGNSHLVFHENFAGDVLEFVVKYIYTGEYSLLDAEKLPEVIRATSKEKFNIPALAKGYLLKQLDAPEGLNQTNWHLFYKNGIKLSLGEVYFNRIYSYLKEKHPEFYKSEEFKGLTFNQICKIMSSPNRPFESNMTIMEATLIWTREHTEAEMDKLAELSKICTNLIQNGNSNPQSAKSPIMSSQILSVDGSLSTPISQPAILSDPHCSTTRKRARSISPQINQNLNSKRSNNEIEATFPGPSCGNEISRRVFEDQTSDTSDSSTDSEESDTESVDLPAISVPVKANYLSGGLISTIFKRNSGDPAPDLTSRRDPPPPIQDPPSLPVYKYLPYPEYMDEQVMHKKREFRIPYDIWCWAHIDAKSKSRMHNM